MTTTFEKLSSNKVKLGFAVEPEKFDEGLQTAYRKLVKQISIPGFRRGKAPMRVIESHYGPSVFYEDAFEAIFPEIYRCLLYTSLQHRIWHEVHHGAGQPPHQQRHDLPVSRVRRRVGRADAGTSLAAAL